MGKILLQPKQGFRTLIVNRSLVNGDFILGCFNFNCSKTIQAANRLIEKNWATNFAFDKYTVLSLISLLTTLFLQFSFASDHPIDFKLSVLGWWKPEEVEVEGCWSCWGKIQTQTHSPFQFYFKFKFPLLFISLLVCCWFY